MNAHKVYQLREGVQVRREAFGLLFYDYRGPRLYFLPSKDLIEDDFFQGRRTAEELTREIAARHGWPNSWIENRLAQVLTTLESKDLIHGQFVC